MYEEFFGLRERPFDLTPNPGFMYLSAKHREALSNIEYGITGRKGITLITGEAGTGKTTVIRAALANMQRPDTSCVYLSNPTLKRGEFYTLLADGFGLSPRAALNKARFLLELMHLVSERHWGGQLTALVIDEAQVLPNELLEEVRLLANLETATEKLLPVVLVGQPELADRLEQPGLRQLKQRVALRCSLDPLDLQETAAYIAGRIWIAGGDVKGIFTKEAVAAVFQASRGIPRTISVICDNALVTAFAADVKPIGPAIIAEVCKDFRLDLPTRGNGEAPQTPSGGAVKTVPGSADPQQTVPGTRGAQQTVESRSRDVVGQGLGPGNGTVRIGGNGDGTAQQAAFVDDRSSLAEQPEPPDIDERPDHGVRSTGGLFVDYERKRRRRFFFF